MTFTIEVESDRLGRIKFINVPGATPADACKAICQKKGWEFVGPVAGQYAEVSTCSSNFHDLVPSASILVPVHLARIGNLDVRMWHGLEEVIEDFGVAC